MGNVCSSGQKKKDADNSSNKSVESPSYQLAEKKQTEQIHPQINAKEAPLADPEPISDLSTGQNTSLATNSPTDAYVTKISQTKTQTTHLTSLSDSVSSTPQTTNPPCDIPAVSALPHNLALLQGKPISTRRTENDRKIVVYVLATDGSHKLERSVLQSIYTNLQERCSCRGFELLISDCHSSVDETLETKVLDFRKWAQSPLEAQGGHEEAANCLAEISRHTNFSYIIPVLLLGTTLGTPLLPLTIENHDFTTAVSSSDNPTKSLLEKWYLLDNTAQPSCYRLNTKIIFDNEEECNAELQELLEALVMVFSKELRDSYLTTIVEQEINNTILIRQELAKRCIWIQSGSMSHKLSDDPKPLEMEMNRRLAKIHADLKGQMSEKNLIRIPPTMQVPEEQLAAILESLLNTVIDGIVDEHANKFAIPSCTFGVDKRLLSEVEAVSQHSKILGQNCANFSIMEKIKSYVTGESTAPVIIFGATGSGKSVLCGKIMHNVHNWWPECSLILRYGNLTELSSHIVSLLASIAEQISVVTTGQPCRLTHSLEVYGKYIKNILATTKIPMVIVIDALDDVIGKNSINWLPDQLSSTVKLIITTLNCDSNGENNNSNGCFLLAELKKQNIPKENFLELTRFSDEQWRDVLSFGGGDFYAANNVLQLPENWKSATEKSPLQAKILWWLAWLGNDDIEDTVVATILNKVIHTLEDKFSGDIVSFLLLMLAASKHGITEVDLLSIISESNTIKGMSAPRLWCKFCWLMGPMLLHSNKIKIMDKEIEKKILQFYGTKIVDVHNTLRDFYERQNPYHADKKGRYKSPNMQKFLQLPYQAFKVLDSRGQQGLLAQSKYVVDLQWVRDKIMAVGCVPVLNDLHLIETCMTSNGLPLENEAHLKLLKNCLQVHMHELNYDGEQFFAIFHGFIQKSVTELDELNKNTIVKEWKDFLSNIKSTYLERLNNFETENRSDEKIVGGFDIITNLGGNGYFVASISTGREEICVWDVSKCKRVRTLKGVPQPTSLCPMGDYAAAVLCKREIKVIDLDEGKFKVTLKGVMNQKMPYFGLHDSRHLVCLSRNRMYVNLMNLESGDCVTTFKAGEDRFLNSLLVSGDGRILVCGDETQKPFPLLVWHLSQRKLLYDLRIPHHDFVTSLSAITHEGSYVCVVAKELNEPTPNFIVVYDLQSGTLFKKWKPSCNTVSITISQTNACVVAGLEDARILIWDLVTGNCRCTLTGHNAPVTLLKLDPLGKILLSGDKDGRDMSVRLWELDSGKSLAVYTPPAKILTCEILSNGKYIVLALEQHSNLITLTLRNYQQDSDVSSNECIFYGNPEFEGKIFEL